MTPHEYSIIQHDRARIGRYLGVTAALIASAATAIAGYLPAIAVQLGLDWISPGLWPSITAAMVFPLVLWVFDRIAWRHPFMLRVLGIADLSGRWKCIGRTLSGTPEASGEWTGEVVISQTWGKIQVALTTRTSLSFSVAASLSRGADGSYLLMYSYRNEPRIGEPMARHIGYAEIRFEPTAARGDGEYFNNKGRVTFGSMTFERET